MAAPAIGTRATLGAGGAQQSQTDPASIGTLLWRSHATAAFDKGEVSTLATSSSSSRETIRARAILVYAGGAEAASATDTLDKLMDATPISEGLDGLKGQTWDVDPTATSDEERELEGRPRPPKGAGWWGIGRPLETRRKGLARPVVDGGGLCSPGRWPLARRRLPNGPLLTAIRGALWRGYLSCVEDF